jgi:glycine hydroxymethyltransferase
MLFGGSLMALANSSSPRLARYLSQLGGRPIAADVAAVLASLDAVEARSPKIAQSIVSELKDQRSHLKLIASENFCSLATQLAQGNWLTDKYAEGYPGHRFYAGCDNVDAIEMEAAELACQLFDADHAYVQPHSGADANLVAFSAILAAKTEAPFLAEIGVENPASLSREVWNQLRARLQSQRLLALDYYSGGHLTHGYRFNLSARLFDVHQYRVQSDTKLLDLDAIRKQVHDVRPTILLAGYSAYPRLINFAKMRELADEVGAVFMVDMAHFAGLVAGKVFTGDYNPVPHAHVVTSTTHKTLRGPRGGIILCKKEFAEFVDKGCPAILGGPLAHVMAAKAVAFREALAPEFQTYARSIVENASALAAACQSEGMSVLTGGTDNHLLLVDVAQSFGLTGRQAESALRQCRFTLNRNSLPDDVNGPWYTSGLRIGTPAVTTLGMGAAEMKEIAAIAKNVLAATRPVSGPDGKVNRAKFQTDEAVVQAARSRVLELLKSYPLYPELGDDI